MICGRRVVMLGVWLEHAVIDLSDIPEPQLGEIVTTIGADGRERILLTEVAAWQELTATDVLITLHGRMPRRYADAARTAVAA